MRRTSPSSDKMLTVGTLERVDEVVVYTGSGTISFTGGSTKWYNPVKDEIVSYKKMLEILKGYQSVGCIVIPLAANNNEPDVRDIEVPEDCIRMVLSDLEGSILRIFDREDYDNWEPSDSYTEYTTKEALTNFAKWMRERDLKTAGVTFMFRGKDSVNKIVSIPV